jgi:hypothetical protein
MFKIRACVQKWRVCLGGGDQEQIDVWSEKLKMWMEGLLENIRDRPSEDYFI